jgi:hypothetical protein
MGPHHFPRTWADESRGARGCRSGGWRIPFTRGAGDNHKFQFCLVRMAWPPLPSGQQTFRVQKVDNEVHTVCVELWTLELWNGGE